MVKDHSGDHGEQSHPVRIWMRQRAGRPSMMAHAGTDVGLGSMEDVRSDEMHNLFAQLLIGFGDVLEMESLGSSVG